MLPGYSTCFTKKSKVIAVPGPTMRASGIELTEAMAVESMEKRSLKSFTAITITDSTPHLCASNGDFVQALSINEPGPNTVFRCIHVRNRNRG